MYLEKNNLIKFANIKINFCFLLISFFVILPITNAEIQEFDFDEETDSDDITKKANKTKNWTLSLSSYYGENDDGIYIKRAMAGFKISDKINQNVFFKLGLNANYFNEDDFSYPPKNQPEWGESWLQHKVGTKCSAKWGKQNISWGEVDTTGALNIITPNDYTNIFTTDFATLKNIPWSITADCYMGKTQIKTFISPKAQVNIYSKEDYNTKLSTEYGSKILYQDTATTYGLYLAKLYENDKNLQNEYLDFNLIGFSYSQNKQGWVYKTDISYRDNVSIINSTKTAPRLDLSIGAEHLTANLHQFTISLWAAKYQGLEQENTKAQQPLSIIQWQKEYQELSITPSVLWLYLREPEITLGKIALIYNYNDYISYDISYSKSHSDIKPNPISQNTITMIGVNAVF
ncbi:MAG: hypothetical protein DRQ51_09155 [Gammaproteobacteria bacterium]|nr:MAG: hypothetical protein DRQ51_09155 [Gammaproteobacteria bacterium]